jgi:GH43 family beta-xylosidase
MSTPSSTRRLRATALLLLAAACSGGRAATAPAPARPEPVAAACTFTNPLAPGADPWVVQHAGAYYLVQSQRNEIWVYRSATLTGAASGRDGVRVWAAPDTGWNQTSVWAPELHRIDGRWYIYYAAGRPGPTSAPFIHQRSGVLQSLGDDPQGTYVDKGMLYTGDDVATGADPKWAIDVTTHVLDGQRYAVWSGWERNTTIARTPQHLYIARMSNPWTVSSNRVKISSPVESWERRTDPVDGLDLQEGPEFLARDGQLFIIYSTRESWLPAYRLGQLRLTSPTADPMSPTSYVKTGPVFASANGVVGVGHNGFTLSPDGTEHWMLYHAKVDTTPGWNRVIRMQKFTWNADGSPNFGVPVPSGQPLPVPSGECR